MVMSPWFQTAFAGATHGPAVRITPLQICGFLGAALDGLFQRNSLLA
jgi:hypothetical protein